MSNNFIYRYNIKNNSQPSKTTIKANNHPHKLHFHWIWNVKKKLKNIYSVLISFNFGIIKLFFHIPGKTLPVIFRVMFSNPLDFSFSWNTGFKESSSWNASIWFKHTAADHCVTVFFYNTMRYFVTLIQLSWEPYFELNSQIR